MSTADNPPAPLPEQGPAAAPSPPTPDGPADASTGIQESPASPAGVTIPLPPPGGEGNASVPLGPSGPPPRKPPSPERLARSIRRLDVVLTGLVLLFAFLAASFPVTNSDFFQHLAVGRLVAQGRYSFGTDPFTFTAEGVRWVNHSWLFDLALYGLYSIPSVGGIIVVVAKALLMTLLALLLLGAGRRAGRSLWIPAACTALAVLALSPRLYLQPACVSFLFLGLTVWLLDRPRRLRESGLAPSPEQSPYRCWWWLPPLFALWVNLDGWFLLGPLTVALYLLGEALQDYFGPAEEPGASRRTTLVTLSGVLAVGVLACLVNPYHVQALALPDALGLSAAGRAVSKDSQFAPLFTSPLRAVYFQRGAGLNPAGMAYFVLAGLGLASFLANLGAWRAWRVLTWVAFLMLSLYNARAIPFFAVVAGPITALNFLDLAARRFGTALRLDDFWRGWSISGRWLTVILALVLAVASVPGWPQADPPRRHVGWSVVTDPSLREVALQVGRWREEGLVPEDAHWFNTTPELLNYLAWYCPGARAFMDRRLALFDGAAHDYAEVRRSLGRTAGRPGAGPAQDPDTGPDWRRVFRQRDIRLVLCDAVPLSPGLETQILVGLLADPKEWQLCYLRGHVAVFAWKQETADGKRDAGPYDRLRLDEGKAAFGPGADRAPDHGPAQAPEPKPWWLIWWQPQRPHSLDTDTAWLQSYRFEVQKFPYARRYLDDLQRRMACNLVGLAAAPGGPVPGTLFSLRMAQAYTPFYQPQPRASATRAAVDLAARYVLDNYIRLQDAGPPDALYESLRAARRAIALHPDDPYAHLVLGLAYFNLVRQTQEGMRIGLDISDPFLGEKPALVARPFPHAQRIRLVQMATAFQKVLDLKPPLRVRQQAHQKLAQVFHHQGFFDLEVQHRKEVLRCMRTLGPSPGQSPEEFVEALQQLEKQTKDLERDVNNARDEYEVNAAPKKVLDRAAMALKKGLAQTALDVLRQAQIDELRGTGGKLEGVQMELDLFLRTGHIEDARVAFSSEGDEGARQQMGLFQVNNIGLPAFDWFRLQAAAASGDYRLAGQITEELRALQRRGPEQLVRANIAAGLGRLVLNQAPPFGVLQTPFTLQSLGLLEYQRTALMLQPDAALLALRGWLALEEGDIAAARAALEKARALSYPDGWPPRRPVAPLNFPSVPLTGYCVDLLEKNAR